GSLPPFPLSLSRSRIWSPSFLSSSRLSLPSLLVSSFAKILALSIFPLAAPGFFWPGFASSDFGSSSANAVRPAQRSPATAKRSSLRNMVPPSDLDGSDTGRTHERMRHYNRLLSAPRKVEHVAIRRGDRFLPPEQ